MNYNISDGILYVFRNATAEFLSSNYESMSIDHVVLGLLKFAELPIEKYISEKDPIAKEIQSSRDFFSEYNVDTFRESRRIQKILKKEKNNWYSELLLTIIMTNLVAQRKKAELSIRRVVKKIEVEDLIDEIKDHPSELLLSILYPEITSDNGQFTCNPDVFKDTSRPYAIFTSSRNNNDMVMLRVIEAKEYDYVLTECDGGKTRSFPIQFYDAKVEVGDILMIHKDVVNEINLFAFGPLTCRQNILPKDIIKLISLDKMKSICLLRYYG